MSGVLLRVPRLKMIVTRPICRLSTLNAVRSAGMAGAMIAASSAAMKTPTNSTVRMRRRAAGSIECGSAEGLISQGKRTIRP